MKSGDYSKTFEASLNDNNQIDSSNTNTNNNKLNDSKISIDRQFYGFKVILIGDINVGKTTIFNQFCKTKSKSKKPLGNTVGAGFIKISIPLIESNTVADLHIWDTSGEERFKTITQQYYKDINGCFIVFDLSDENSFKNLDKWVTDVRNIAPKNIELLIIGNKCDIPEERKIETKEAMDYAFAKGLEYYEISALTGFNIKLILETLTKNMIVLNDVIDLKKMKESFGKKYKGENFDLHREGRVSLSDNNRSSVTIIEDVKKKKCC